MEMLAARRSARSPPFEGPLARRKLFDEALSEFLIGNTFSRQLVDAEELRVFADIDGSDSESETNSDESNCSKKAKVLRLMWVGVGDVRNPLATLHCVRGALPASKCELHLNDVSSVTLARDAVLLTISAGDGVFAALAAISLWSDACIKRQVNHVLVNALKKLLGDGSEIPFLQFNDERTKYALKKHWRQWLRVADVSGKCRGTGKAREAANRLARCMEARAKALSVKGAGHGRAGASPWWRKAGVASMSSDAFAKIKSEALRVNPTLYDMSDERCPRYLECQGPAGAFASLRGDVGSESFAETLREAWKPLFDSFRSAARAGAVVAHLSLGDCMEILEQPRFKSAFHAIDTSNVMDYVGMWNLALRCSPCLDESVPGWNPFVFMEQILGVASDIDYMLAEVYPCDANLTRKLAQVMGLVIEKPPDALAVDDREKVVHARWIRDSVNEEVAHSMLGIGTEWEEDLHALLQTSLVPLHMSAHMLSDVRAPIMMSYMWPTATTATFVAILAMMCEKCPSACSQCLQRFFSESEECNFYHVRNRVLALRIQCSLLRARLGPALGATGSSVLYSLNDLGAVTLRITPAGIDPFSKRGGVFEPALAVMLLRNQKALETASNLSGKWFKDAGNAMASEDPVNALFDWVGARNGKTVQIVDNLKATKTDEGELEITFVLPINDTNTVRCRPSGPLHAPTYAFRYLVVIDVQSFEIISKSINLRDAIPHHFETSKDDNFERTRKKRRVTKNTELFPKLTS